MSLSAKAQGVLPSWAAFAALLVLMFAVIPVATAAMYPDQGRAYAACQRDIAGGPSGWQPMKCKGDLYSNGSGVYYALDASGRAVGWDYAWGANTSCKSRVDGQAGMINGTLYSGGVCDNGCKVQPNLDPGTNYSIRESGNPNAIAVRSGTWKATGDVCSITDTQPKPDPKNEYCHTTSSGHQVCKGKDRTCVTSPSGFRTCASDTANEKGHTATNNPRTEATSIGAPNTPPNAPTNRPGEDWKPSGPSTTITNNNSGSTTNTQNYNNQGTPNGNQPTPGDGSGPGSGGSNGNGDGDDGGSKPDYGSVGGDGKCTGSFTCSGGDPVLCAIAQQTYNQRCEAEARWGDGEGGGTFPGDGDGGAGQDPDPKKSLRTATPSLNMIDKGGFFGGGSCPQFAVADTSFGPFSFNDVDFCKLVVLVRNCLMLLGAFIALAILMGWQGKD